MWQSFLLILPITISAALMALGNGFLASFLPTRIPHTEIPIERSSDFVAAYAVGMMFAALYISKLIKRVGHIRSFAILASGAALTNLALQYFDSYGPWLGIRFINGFTANAIFVVAHSWLNDQVENQYRGRILTSFSIIYLIGIGTGSYMIAFFDPMKNDGFIFAVAIYILAMLPVAFTRIPAPPPPEETKLFIKKFYRNSPVAFFGCFLAGSTAMTMQGMGAVIGLDMGLEQNQIALMMSVAQVGSLLQFPLGILSDKIDRRYVLILVGGSLTITGFTFGMLNASYFILLVVTLAFFMGLGESAYSISAANANDRAKAGEFTSIAGTGTLIWCVGALIGPLVGAATMTTMGAQGVTSFFVIIAASFAIFTIWRCFQKEAPEDAEQQDFIPNPSELANSELYIEE